MNTTYSQYMDKKIMNGFSSETAGINGNNGSSSNNDFIDFMNGPPEKEGLVPRYDFMPVRPAAGLSSQPADRPSNFDTGDDDAPIRSWNSVDTKANASAIRSYGSVDAEEPAKFILGKNGTPSSIATSGVSLVSEIDKTMKKYMDNQVHALDGMSARLLQLETRTCNLENSVDDLKVSVGNNHEDADGKLIILENILREVQLVVLVIKDKQEILEAESKKIAENRSTTAGVTAPQHFSAVSPPQPHLNSSPSNAPQPPKLQNLQPQAHLPNQFPPNQHPFVPMQPESYMPSPSQTQENLNQQYQIPLPLPQHLPAPPLSQHQCQSSPLSYSQPPPSSQPHNLFLPLNSAIPQPQVYTPHEETSYSLLQNFSQGIHQLPSHQPTRAPPSSQQYYGPNPSVYEPPSSRPGPGYPGSCGPSSLHQEPYPYSDSPSHHGSSSSMKQRQLSSIHMRQGGGTEYLELPTARLLPQALPTASPISESSGSGGSGNKSPNDDIVNRVTNMGFPRDQVRATIQRLTESGQAVDLNIVLDKLMNDG